MQPPYGLPPGAPGPGGFVPPPGGFAPPPGGYGMPPLVPVRNSGPEWAKTQVAPPAIALMITTGLACLWYLAITVMVLFAGGLGFLESSSGGGGDPLAGVIGGVLGGAVYGFFAIMALVAFVGAFRMRTLKGYAMSMTSAILALLPCTTYVCCIFTMPFGIWALVVLMKPEVKAEFR